VGLLATSKTRNRKTMRNNKQQTTVDWIEQEMLKGNLSLKEILEQAKEMDKKQSINDFVAGNKLEFYDGTEKECAEQYYKLTYGGNK
jgi:hypothetical protein